MAWSKIRSLGDEIKPSMLIQDVVTGMTWNTLMRISVSGALWQSFL